MKIKITTQELSASQKFFAQPLDLGQRVEMKKLLFVEQLLTKMQTLGMKRKELAEAMNVVPARITKMLKGTENMTIDTLMRSADAVGCEVHLHLADKKNKVRITEYDESETHPAFTASEVVADAKSSFLRTTDLVSDEQAYAA